MLTLLFFEPGPVFREVSPFALLLPGGLGGSAIYTADRNGGLYIGRQKAALGIYWRAPIRKG